MNRRSRRATLSASAVAAFATVCATAAPTAAAAAAPAAAIPTLPAAQAQAPAVATDTSAVTHAQNDRVPEGASWTQHYFPSSDGSDVELHADVLLPQGLPPGEKVPVILSVGPYFGHSGEVTPEPWTHTGPSARFDDLLQGGNLLERGYALVHVDSRGFGGSTGCHDLAGPGEQADVAAAVAWAAGQPWSTGAVGMYGKSYDAITGLIGANLDQDALKAVVAQEPIWEPSTNFRSGGVPRATIVSVAGAYAALATMPQMPDDDQRYRDNAAWETANPQCLLDIFEQYKTADEGSDYWKARDLPEQAAGATCHSSSPRGSWSGTPRPSRCRRTWRTTRASSGGGWASGTTCGATTVRRTGLC